MHLSKILSGFCGCSGSGPRYTSLQAAMVLQKLKAVEFLIDQPSIDLDVKSTDGKSTLIIAVESKVRKLFQDGVVFVSRDSSFFQST